MKSVQQVVDDYVSDNHTTKEALAKEVEIGRTSFFSKLRGSSEFSLSEGYRLAKVLGYSLDDFYSLVANKAV